MTILRKYNVSWFHELTFGQMKEVLAAPGQFKDWNRLGFLRALVEHKQLSFAQTIILRDAFSAKYERYYLHRAFTDTETVAFLEYLDVEDRPEYVGFDRFGRRRTHFREYEKYWSVFLKGDPRLTSPETVTLRPIAEADYFFEAAFQRGISKVRKGVIRAYPEGRTRTALSDPYEAYFGDVVNAPFEKTNAHELKAKYSYNKRNGAKYQAQHQPNYPVDTPPVKGTKNHKRLYQRLGEKRNRAAGKQVIRNWEEE